MVIQQDKEHVERAEKKIILETTEKEQRKKALKERIELINSWSWIVILILIVFFLGVHTGLNLLTKGVLCPSRESLCYFLRFDNNKKYLER